jgi:hypothetical protein
MFGRPFRPKGPDGEDLAKVPGALVEFFSHADHGSWRFRPDCPSPR